MNQSLQPVPGKWSVYDRDGKLTGAGYASKPEALAIIPPSARDEYKVIIEAEPQRELRAVFDLSVSSAAVNTAAARYAKSLGSDFKLGELRVFSRESSTEVIGRPCAVMAIIGMVADMGHDGLVSVS